MRIRNKDEDSWSLVRASIWWLVIHLSQKKLKKLITFKFGGNSSVIDYVVVNKKLMKRARDVMVIPGEE